MLNAFSAVVVLSYRVLGTASLPNPSVPFFVSALGVLRGS